VGGLFERDLFFGLFERDLFLLSGLGLGHCLG
jgi:hypothetical protein